MPEQETPPSYVDHHGFRVGRLRLLWDEGGGPLWGNHGELPSDPAWLREALGLSDRLIADLAAWQRDMDALFHGPPLPQAARHTEQDLKAAGEELAARLKTELGDVVEVAYDYQ